MVLMEPLRDVEQRLKQSRFSPLAKLLTPADIPATDVDEVGSFPVTVYDPGPPAEETGAVLFYVVEEVWEVWLPVVGR